MLRNTQINRLAIKKVATALEELNKDVVYVGGAVVSLYINDPAAEDVRPTKDIDISLEILSLSDLENLRVTLSQKGFKQNFEDDVICRFRYDDIKIDVMSTQAVGWAPSNIWFDKGFKKSNSIYLDEIEIRILPLVYFLATKFSAFKNRRGNDPRTSHDFEDITYLLNYTSNLKELVLLSNDKVKTFLKNSFLEIINDSFLQEAMIGNLFYEDQTFRFNKIMNMLNEVVKTT